MPTHPACPRCGYDQTGAVASWQRVAPAACPLEGLCSECGLGFAWRDLLNPAFASEQRLFEHAARRPLSSLVLTAWRALRPSGFWGWVRMEHAIRWRRLLVGAAAGALLVHAAAVAAVMGLWLAAFEWDWAFGPQGQAPLMRYARGVTSRPMDHFVAALWPIRHGMRGEMSTSDLYTSWAAVSLVIAVFMPAAFLALPHTLRRARTKRVHLVRIAAYSIVGLPVVLAVPGIVDAIHGIGVATGLSDWSGTWVAQLDRALYSRGKLWVFGLVFLWLWAWWCAASRRYLRLPQPHIAATAAAMMAGAAALLVGLMVPGLPVAMWREW